VKVAGAVVVDWPLGECALRRGEREGEEERELDWVELRVERARSKSWSGVRRVLLGRADRRWGDDGLICGDEEGLVLVAGPPGAGDGPEKDEKAKLRRALSGLVAGGDCDGWDPKRR
jgi:hypothetical protein